jgi:hypothetical protein
MRRFRIRVSVPAGGYGRRNVEEEFVDLPDDAAPYDVEKECHEWMWAMLETIGVETSFEEVDDRSEPKEL